jgi:hypothetical protein
MPTQCRLPVFLKLIALVTFHEGLAPKSLCSSHLSVMLRHILLDSNILSSPQFKIHVVMVLLLSWNAQLRTHCKQFIFAHFQHVCTSTIIQASATSAIHLYLRTWGWPVHRSIDRMWGKINTFFLSLSMSYPPPNLAAFSQVGELRLTNQKTQHKVNAFWMNIPVRKSKKDVQVLSVKCNCYEITVKDMESRIVCCKETEAYRDLIFWPGSQRRVLVLLCRETSAELESRVLFSDNSVPEDCLCFRPHNSAASPWPQSTLNKNADQNFRKNVRPTIWQFRQTQFYYDEETLAINKCLLL